MMIDQDYLRRLLEAFEDHGEPVIDVLQLRQAGFVATDSQFLFHMRILEDQNLIRREDREPDLGAKRESNGEVVWFKVPLRLTAAGHEFLADIHQPGVWEKIRSDFKQDGIATLIKVAKSLGQSVVEAKLKKIVDADFLEKLVTGDESG